MNKSSELPDLLSYGLREHDGLVMVRVLNSAMFVHYYELLFGGNLKVLLAPLATYSLNLQLLVKA